MVVSRGPGATLGPALVDRYLRALGVSRSPPSRDALSELVEAHLTRVPFENVSKILRRKHLGLEDVPSIELFLEGIERHHLGGTCYSNNHHLQTLLRSLGYDARLCGADMDEPDVHVVVEVALDGRELLVDAGYAAPFLHPMALDESTDVVVASGRDRYVLRPRDGAGRSRLEQYRDGIPTHAYVAKPEPRRIEEFRTAIAASFRPDARFLNSLLLTRFSPGRAVRIHDLEVTERDGAWTRTRTLRSGDDLAVEIERRFAIPATLAAEAIDTIRHS